MNTCKPAMQQKVMLAIATALTLYISPATAQEDAPDEPMDHAQMNHEAMATPADPKIKMMDVEKTRGTSSINHSMRPETKGMMQGAMQGGSAPADARDPHAYSGGYDFGPIPRPRLADEYSFASLRVDRLEAVQDSDNSWITYDLQAWYGRDYNRAVLKAEGDYDDGSITGASTELLWGHAIATYWDTQLGLRYDNGDGPNRSWLALGIQGLAPYWFELDTTFYIGDEGRTALALEAEYELLLSQKLILQPRLETNLYGKADAERGLGSGLSDISVGVRLRYELRREFAPYIGVEWTSKFGDTADYAQAGGAAKSDTVTMAGVRFWF